jgi:hypothetical protein
MQEQHLNPDRPEHTEPLTPAERELAEALGSLSPARPSLGRERILFESGRTAGEAAARRRLFAWRAAAAVLLVGLGLSMVLRDQRRVVERERVVYLPAPPVAATLQTAAVTEGAGEPPQEWPAAGDPRLLASHGRPLMPSSAADYVTVRDAVLRWGVRAMPAPKGGGGVAAAFGRPEPTVNGLLDIPSRETARGAWHWGDVKGFFFGDRL